jgi:hypothetical protein
MTTITAFGEVLVSRAASADSLSRPGGPPWRVGQTVNGLRTEVFEVAAETAKRCEEIAREQVRDGALERVASGTEEDRVAEVEERSACRGRFADEQNADFRRPELMAHFIGRAHWRIIDGLARHELAGKVGVVTEAKTKSRGEAPVA